MPTREIKIVFLADTHGMHDQVEVPAADILVHAGDITSGGDLDRVEPFSRWLQSLPHAHKIVIAGNHDFCFERQGQTARAALQGCTYLQDEAVSIEGIKFYGSPWQPWFFDWAFNLPRDGAELARRWDAIPTDTEVLITHGPPAGIGDQTSNGQQAGCDLLRKRVETIQPKIHAFGHIHEAYGQTQLGQTLYLNASICNLAYQPIQKPIVLTIPTK